MRQKTHATLFLCLAPVILLLVALFMACKGEETVFLELGSQGTPGDGIVYGLDSGSMYLVRNGHSWYPVNSSGKISRALRQLNYIEINEAAIGARLQPLAPGVTAITGFTNDMTVSVYKYGKPGGNWYLVPDRKVTQSPLGDQFVTWQRNMVIDLAHIDFRNAMEITNSGDVMGMEACFIFVTADLINVSQKETSDQAGSRPPDIIGGAGFSYEFGNLPDCASIRPFVVEVSSAPGEKGYFTMNGCAPSKLIKNSKRGTDDEERNSGF